MESRQAKHSGRYVAIVPCLLIFSPSFVFSSRCLYQAVLVSSLFHVLDDASFETFLSPSFQDGLPVFCNVKIFNAHSKCFRKSGDYLAWRLHMVKAGSQGNQHPPTGYSISMISAIPPHTVMGFPLLSRSLARYSRHFCMIINIESGFK